LTWYQGFYNQVVKILIHGFPNLLIIDELEHVRTEVFLFCFTFESFSEKKFIVVEF